MMYFLFDVVMQVFWVTGLIVWLILLLMFIIFLIQRTIK